MFLGHSAPNSQNSPVKFAQCLSITVAGGSLTGTGTLSQGVQVNKAVVLNNGVEDPDGYLGTITEAAATFSSISSGVSSQITVTFNSTTTNPRIVDVEVVEFYPWAVVDVQHSSVALGSGTLTADSAALTRTVNPNFASAIHCGVVSTSASQNVSKTNATALLKGTGDRVTATRLSSTDSLTLYFSVIEWQPSVIKSRQQVSITFPGTSVASSTAAISAVDPNYSLLIWGGMNNNAFMPEMLDVALTSGTVLTATQGGAAAVDSSRIAIVTVIEFNKKYIKSKNASRDATGTATNVVDTTITAVVLARTMFSRVGFSTNNAFSNSSLGYMRSKLTSSTNVESKRSTFGSSTTATSSWNALEFYG